MQQRKDWDDLITVHLKQTKGKGQQQILLVITCLTVIPVNTFGTEENGQYFMEDIFKCVFL